MLIQRGANSVRAEALRCGVTRDPIREQGQHPLEVGGFREAVIGPGKNFQLFSAWQGIEQSLALVQGDKLIVVALHNQRGRHDSARRFVRHLPQAILVKLVAERNAGGAAMKIRDAIRSFPFVKSRFAKFKPKLFAKVDHGTFQPEAGQRWNGPRLSAVRCCPLGRSEE